MPRLLPGETSAGGVPSQLTVKGSAMSSSESAFAGKILAVGTSLNAPTVALVASIYAGIWESGLGQDLAYNSSGYGGVLAGGQQYFGALGDPGSDAVTNAQATRFFSGGDGYESGGAIALAGQGVTNPVEIAVRVEVPSIWPNNAYAAEGGYLGDSAATAEAAAIVSAFGGGALPGGTAGLGGTGLPQNDLSNSAFTVGDVSNPSEDYWTAGNRLAQARYWYFFSDGEVLYLADGNELMKQSPVLTLDRHDNADRISHLNPHYDNTSFQYASTHKHKKSIQRRAALAKIPSPTQVLLDVICDIDDVRGGDVIFLSGSGPADGKWLVASCRRSIFEVKSQLTLVPALTPLSEQQVAGVSSTNSSRTGGVSGITGGASATVTAAVAAARALGAKNLPYDQGHRTLLQGGPPAGDGYDCSAGVAWVLLTAGFTLPGNATWGSSAPVSGDFESWGDPGPGQQMTIWANANHIFIEFNVPGLGHYGFDSGHDSSANPWFAPFYDQSYVASGENGVPFIPRHWTGT